jgi:hypothetical protein
VLDSVDDARFLLSGQANGDGDGDGQGQTTNAQVIRKPLREYLPRCERGSILVRTRNKDTALRLVERHNDIVSVDPMDEAQALALFKKKLGAQGDKSDVAELAAALEYMPLAIVQAAAYISQRAPRYLVAKYLEEFRKSERKRTSLLNRDEGYLRRDWEAKNSIIITWQISFEYIEQTRSFAADLLSLMSFLDRQGIPKKLLQPRTERGETQTYQTEKEDKDRDSDSDDTTSQSSASDEEFEDAIAMLQSFCFISTDPDGSTFEMHALVQLAMRRWLEGNGKLERWKQQFASNLCAAFLTGEYENWAVCQELFAHARSALGQPPEDESSLAEWASLLYRAAWYARALGNITDAAMLAIKSMKTRKNVLGQEHEDTLWSIAMVGIVYKLGGRLDNAEKLQVQVMERFKTRLGADHPDTLMSMVNLAATYISQGRWDDAAKLGVQVMETRKTKLGADHPSTLTSMANLAPIYRNQGRWDAAEELEVQVMETSKKKLGADHPDTLRSMKNPAFTWKAQGRSAEAVVLMRQCVQKRQQVLKASHPSLKSSLAVLEQ